MGPFASYWANILLFVFISLLCVYSILTFIKSIISKRSEHKYEQLLVDPETPLHTDDFVGPLNPISYTKVTFLHWFNVGDRKPSNNAIRVVAKDSEHVDGLKVNKAAPTQEQGNDQESNKKSNNVVIGTIRMGFGHHRIAYSAASWSLGYSGGNHETIFHDFLGIDSVEAELIKSTDKLYSKGSRIASDMGGLVESLWGKSMLSGDADALRAASLFAAHLRPLINGIGAKDTPIIATHQIVGLTAVAAGFTNVINLVIDNHPQWFLLVPGALNLVQGPVNYQAFLKMGVPKSQLRLVGHWCPHQLVTNIPEDCNRRIRRATNNNSTKFAPRILVPVGGAGAQRKFILSFLTELVPLLKQKSVYVFLNAGDHKHMKEAFHELLAQHKIDYDTVSTIHQVYDFQKELLKADDAKPKNAVTLFAFDDYFPAVATTDILCRVSDILSCKPSELAFYPIPKILIRRVGDHEADSANRSAELGDGTCEARTVDSAMSYVNLAIDCPDMLTQMNESIIKNNDIGIYSGCKEAVNIAMQMAKSNS